ncbi:MAG: alpha/beta hydrolase, partial [Gammaproteobacteria bacterium]|nr:alpha/beta hydrolase [Gammaproteobacteria bacterium]
MRRGYVDIGSAAKPCQVHYRTLGSGPPLIMLHASPMSSAALAPLLQAVAGHVTAIAPDTPGYGLSDPLDDDRQDLVPYVDALDRVRAALGLERFGLYGSATGAQIGIEYARTHPQRIDYLVLDNAAHFTDAERSDITAGYFPDLTPDAMGSHLARIWTVAREQLMFFPWFMHEPATRLPGAFSDPAIVQAITMAYLGAGPGYDRAYRAAFANEDRDRLAGITVPTAILRWQGSILKPYTDRFDERDWNDNFEMVPAGPAPAD